MHYYCIQLPINRNMKYDIHGFHLTLELGVCGGDGALAV